MADNILTTDRTTANIAIAAKDVAGVLLPRNIITDPAGADITPLTDAALRAAPVPVSAIALPLPSGAATETTSAAILAKIIAAPSTEATLSTINGKIPATVAGSQPVTLRNAAGTGIASLALATTLEGILTSAGATDFFFSTANATTVQLAASATFTGTIESIISAQAWSIILTSDQPGTLTLIEYIDAAGLRPTSTKTIAVAANVPLSRCYTANGNYFKLTFQNTGASTTTTLNINTAFGVLPAVTGLGNGPVALNEINGTAFSLGQAASALSLPVAIASDTASGSITTQNLAPAGVATAGSAVEITLSGASTLSIQTMGTYTGALSLQATLDGTTWVTMGGTPLINVNTGGYLASITSALQSVFQADVAGFTKARITGLAAVTGSATVTLRTTAGAAAMVALDNSLPTGANVIGAVTGSGTFTVDTELMAAANILDGLAASTTSRVGTDSLLFNGTTWDRARANLNTTTGDTGAKTVTGNGATQVNYNASGAYILINMGVVTGTTPTLDAKVQVSMDTGTTWVDLPGAAFVQFTATGTKMLAIYPGVTVAANTAVSAPLPRTWRIVWTVGGTTPSFTITNIQVAYID